MDTFQALADPTRRHIIELLAARGEMSASDIFERFPISSPAVSQHLKVLKKTKIVAVEKKAQKRIYRLNPAPMHEIGSWIAKLTAVWDERFDRLDKVLKNKNLYG